MSDTPHLSHTQSEHEADAPQLNTLANSIMNDVDRKSNMGLAKQRIITPKVFVIVLSVMQGLFEICSLARFYYQKDQLQLEPTVIQMIDGLVSIPWCIKPLFGYATDRMLKRFGKTKHIVLVTSAVRIAAYSILARYKVGTALFFFLSFALCLCYLFENIVSEYILVLITLEKNAEDGTSSNNQMPHYYGFRAAGSLVGAFLGGRIIHRYGVNATFAVSSVLPVVSIFAALVYAEQPQDANVADRSFREEMRVMWELVCRDKVLLMVVFIMLINLTPIFETLIAFYLTDYLHFSAENLANFNAFATVCYILSLVLYSNFFMRVDARVFYQVTNVILWATNLSFLLVSTKTLDRYGVSNKAFCFLSQGAHTLIAEINFMPILAVWVSLVPKSLEATSITLFSGLINFSNNLANYFGSLILYVLEIHRDSFDDIWKPIVVQNSYLLLVMIGLCFVPFPDPTTPERGAVVVVADVVGGPAKDFELVD